MKGRRHEYETVWVDGEGNELEEPPEEAVAAPEKRNGTKPKPKAKATQQRGGRPIKVPPPPSWPRAIKRAGLIGVVIFVFLYIAGTKSGGRSFATALFPSVIYTAVFIPFQYMLDRFLYTRWQRRAEQQGQKPAAKKR